MDQRISFVTLAVADLEPPWRSDPDGHRGEIATHPGPIGQRVLP